MFSNRLLCVLTLTFFLTSCHLPSSEGVVQTAIAATLAAQASATPETVTPSPFPTMTASVSQTPLPLSELLPKDFVIDTDPAEFVLLPSDLPQEEEYYLPGPNWAGEVTNQSILTTWPPGKGDEFIERTGRVRGYAVTYLRGTNQSKYPAEVYCQVIQFRTTEGAQIFVTDYTMAARFPNQGWQAVDRKMDLGDLNHAEFRVDALSNNLKKILYYLEFSYFNYAAYLYSYDYETSVSHEFIEMAARKVLTRIQAAPFVPSSLASFNQ